ncbi:hypothetical protein N657DRAFT_101572 [Parathielavia appendiculata]|uniref:Uncharacterized protein n=1 Tax=Parathielavia appendiculata TaxID=2587402 RepID=A0AAN6TW76_9PEZI|nr:hypothetical protein N657DRAFT_101572 [Parathielavia appendiculata]
MRTFRTNQKRSHRSGRVLMNCAVLPPTPNSTSGSGQHGQMVDRHRVEVDKTMGHIQNGIEVWRTVTAQSASNFSTEKRHLVYLAIFTAYIFAPTSINSISLMIK